MKVLVTGATGFIGSHIVRYLVKKECEVYVIYRQESNLWRILDILSQVHLISCDLLDLVAINNLPQIEFDVCIHSAWYAIPGKYLAAQENIHFLNATLALAMKLQELGCQYFIGIGSCFEYDSSLGYLSETSPNKPQHLYSASKLATQIVLEQWAKISGMKFSWIRLFYQYGAFEDQRRLVPAVITSLLEQTPVKLTLGEQIRDFLLIEDVAAAIYAVVQAELLGVVNIGSGQPVTVRDIAETIGTILARTELLEFGAKPYAPLDPKFICANNSRLRQETNWTPRYTLETGLGETIEWWKKFLANGKIS
ncbi:MAG: NAD(P)-dependent oxidoreductase [Coleofasciculaceae cyanobacterium SM2_1_6]|nr:NAD(P)-dependent oxidoreductase [Coleofasciculaceae cyanobacterium SM2_1_6]